MNVLVRTGEELESKVEMSVISGHAVVDVSDLLDEAPFTPCAPSVGPVVGAEHTVLTPGNSELADSLGSMLPSLDLSQLETYLMSGDGWLDLSAAGTAVAEAEAVTSASASASLKASKAQSGTFTVKPEPKLKLEPLESEEKRASGAGGRDTSAQCSCEESDSDGSMASSSASELGLGPLDMGADGSGSAEFGNCDDSESVIAPKRCNTYSYGCDGNFVTVKLEPLEAIISTTAAQSDSSPASGPASSPGAGSTGQPNNAPGRAGNSPGSNTRTKGGAPVRALAASGSNCGPDEKPETPGPRVMAPKPECNAGNKIVTPPFPLPLRGARMPIIVPNTAGAPVMSF